MTAVIRAGIDLVTSDRVALMLHTVGDSFLRSTWTDEEIRHCQGDVDRLAARWAAKEATIKALHTNISDVPLTDICVTTREGGAPQMRLSGAADLLAGALGIAEWSVSLTHDGGMAAAVVIGVMKTQ